MGTYANITVKLADGSQEYLETGEGHPSILGKDLVSAGFWRRTPGGISAEEEGAVMDFFCEEMGASEGHLDNPDYEYFIDPGDLFRCYYRDTQEADDVRHPLISAFVDNDDVENDDIRDLFRQNKEKSGWGFFTLVHFYPSTPLASFFFYSSAPPSLMKRMPSVCGPQ